MRSTRSGNPTSGRLTKLEHGYGRSDFMRDLKKVATKSPKK